MEQARPFAPTLALFAFVSVGCADPKPAPPQEASETQQAEPEEAPAPTAQKPQGTLHAHMQDHFVRVDEMRLAIVEGKLDVARSRADWLANHPPHTDLPKGWEPYIQMMRSQAREVLEEQTLAEAAMDTARVAGTCGSCHFANKAKVHLGAAPEPENHQPLEHHMWAAERLWDAVVSQSGDLWKMGVASLNEAAVVPPDMDAPPPRLAKAKAAFAKLQQAARDADSPNARVEVLGTYLGQCQGCHQQAKKALDAF